jgi:hypothetical protein
MTGGLRGSDASARATVGRTAAARDRDGRCYFRSSAAFFTISGGVA